MRLTGVRIRDFRSVFDDQLDQAFEVDLADGMNTFVGRNNCGKSNVLRAVELALDPAARFDPGTDIPGPRQFSYPVITLRFDATSGSEEENELLESARRYERSVAKTGRVFADEGLVVFEVSFPPAERGGQERVEILRVASGVRPDNPDQVELLDQALSRLRATVRFVLISSGESLRTFLEGNFKEILHTVIRERLQEHFEQAEQSRLDYITGLQDNLLGPLRDQLRDIVIKLFPEIEGITLSPEVSGIDATLSNVGVNVRDIVDTPLSAKGTGVRGGVLVAMLRYLADNATRGMVFALEEPEAFLHPAAQEDLRDNLEALAARNDVTLLVTTHSPFVVSRESAGQVFSLAKDKDGRTRLSASAPGDAPHAPLVGDLFRDLAFDELLARATDLPGGKAAILLVEGEGDQRCLELVANRAGHPELLTDIHIQPAGGTKRIVAQAIVARAAAQGKPVLVLVDNDEPGRLARKELKEKFQFQNNRELLSYSDVFPKDQQDFPYEAEDLFPPELIEDFVTEHGNSVVDGTKRRPDGAFHYDLGASSKELLGAHLSASLTPAHLELWLELIARIRKELGLGDAPQPDVETTAEQQVSSPALTRQQAGLVLVLGDQTASARYQESSACVLDPARPVAPEVTHVAFYVDGVIRELVPAIKSRYSSLRFDDETVNSLSRTNKDIDTRAADLIRKWVSEEIYPYGSVHQLLLLSAPQSEETLRLDQPVENTKLTSKGRPMAWLIGQRTTAYSALAQSPSTTDELEQLGG